MYHALNLTLVWFENKFFERRLIPQIDLLEHEILWFIRDLLHPVQRGYLWIVHVVNDEHIDVVFVYQFNNSVGADVSQSTCNEYVFFTLFVSIKSLLHLFPIHYLVKFCRAREVLINYEKRV